MHAEHADQDRQNDLSGRMIGCAFTVFKTLGAGFLEKVYENASAHEPRFSGLSMVQQYCIRLHYKDVVAGKYFVDESVEERASVSPVRRRP